MSSSSIDSLTPRIDSSIESHIHLRSRHSSSLTSHVSFASGCTASQFAILNSVKRTATVPRIFPTNLVESRNTGYKPVEFTANRLTTPYNVSSTEILNGCWLTHLQWEYIYVGQHVSSAGI